MAMSGGLGSALVGGCARETRIVDRPVTLHVPAACPLGSGAFAQYYVQGDFDPTPERPATEGRPATERGPFGVLDGELLSMRALAVDVSDPSTSKPWRGLGLVSGGALAPLDVLLLPLTQPCFFTGSMDRRTDGAAAIFDGRHGLFVGGRSEAGVPRSFSFDVGTGVVNALPNGLRTPRRRPSITAFDGGTAATVGRALVAGGGAIEDDRALDTAEVWSPGTGDIEPRLLALGEARAHHGAVVLQSGETLLVGGVDASGTTLPSLLVVDPVSERPRSQGLARLTVARRDPVVVRLTNGEVLVAGGTDLQDRPVGTLEWLTSDARGAARRSADLPASPRVQLAPMVSGGALALLVPSSPGATSPSFPNVWRIRADGAVEVGGAVDGLGEGFALFEGTEGAPLVWTGGANPRWLRFDPWTDAFVPITDAGATGPAPSASSLATPVDRGLALWLGDDGVGVRLAAFRFDVRGPYVSQPAPLLAGSPRYLVPDRLVAGGSSAVALQGDVLSLRERGTVYLADATYGDVQVELTLAAGSAPPLVALRDDLGQEHLLGEAPCPWPPPGGGGPILVERRGAAVKMMVAGGEPAFCGVPTGHRLTLGFRGPAGSAALQRVAIRRL